MANDLFSSEQPLAFLGDLPERVAKRAHAKSSRSINGSAASRFRDVLPRSFAMIKRDQKFFMRVADFD